MFAVLVFQSLCHSLAIVGSAFVANLSVCYLAWRVIGSGNGTSVNIRAASQWLFDG